MAAQGPGRPGGDDAPVRRRHHRRHRWVPGCVEGSGPAGEWQAAFRGRPPARPGREAGPLAGTAPEVARRNLEGFADRLQGVPVSDRVGWSVAARDVSGALSAWARLDPVHAADLRSAASVIARAGQDRRPGAGAGLRVRQSAMGAALVLLAAQGADRPGVAAAALMVQLLRAAAAISDYHRQTRNFGEADAVTAQLGRLAALGQTDYPGQRSGDKVPATPSRDRPVRAGRRGPGLQLPNPLEPRPHTGARPGHERREGRDGGR